jgi:DNA repair exonuclease SbcCD nuclease subunit
MLKFLHISDTHIDYKPQLEYIRNQDEIIRERLNGLYTAINYAASNGISLIVHSGDVFNVSSPKINYIYELQKVFSYAQEKGIEFLIIAGNHDQAKTKSSLNVLKIFEVFKNIHIFIDDGIFNYNGYEFLCIPSKHDWSHVKESFAQSLNALLDKSSSNKRILVSHIPILNVNKSSTLDIEEKTEEEIDKDTIPDMFLYAALGHYHLMQKVKDKMYYSGSSSQLSFNEENEKKYFINVSIDETNNVFSFEPIEIQQLFSLKTITIDASYVTNSQDFIKLLSHEIKNFNETNKINDKIIRINITNLKNAVKINVNNDAILKIILPYNPFGVKIRVSISEFEKINEEAEDIDPTSLMKPPKKEIEDYLKKTKSNKFLTEENEVIMDEFENNHTSDDKYEY